MSDLSKLNEIEFDIMNDSDVDYKEVFKSLPLIGLLFIFESRNWKFSKEVWSDIAFCGFITLLLISIISNTILFLIIYLGLIVAIYAIKDINRKGDRKAP